MQMYVNYYKREITTSGENPPIGIILCAEKNNAVARFTLPEDNKEIFVSKYKLYLPTEEDLVQELEREQRALGPLMEKEKLIIDSLLCAFGESLTYNRCFNSNI